MTVTGRGRLNRRLSLDSQRIHCLLTGNVLPASQKGNNLGLRRYHLTCFHCLEKLKENRMGTRTKRLIRNNVSVLIRCRLLGRGLELAATRTITRRGGGRIARNRLVPISFTACILDGVTSRVTSRLRAIPLGLQHGRPRVGIGRLRSLRHRLTLTHGLTTGMSRVLPRCLTSCLRLCI